jgi:16S rRNA (guanine527-N7)-methyltransferase
VKEAASEALVGVLLHARSLGFLGPGPVEPHIGHAEAFGRAAETVLGRVPASFCDLGTGGGVPGLVLALRWPEAKAVFVESNHRRAAALREGASLLGLETRAEVLEQRAEVLAHETRYREVFEVVTARGFAEPAATAEIATGFVVVGGIIVVSEPPVPSGDRWSTEGLAELSLGPATLLETDGAHFAALEKRAQAPQRYPRAVGRPAKRPRW